MKFANLFKHIYNNCREWEVQLGQLTLKGITWGTCPRLWLKDPATDIRVHLSFSCIGIEVPSLGKVLRFQIGDSFGSPITISVIPLEEKSEDGDWYELAPDEVRHSEVQFFCEDEEVPQALLDAIYPLFE